MDVFNNKNPKKGKKKGKRKKVNGKMQFFSNLVSTILIFMIIASLYSFFTEGQNKMGDVTISQLSLDIKSDIVSDILVEGDKLKVTYKDEEGVDGIEKKSKKEVGGTLSETLTNYGVTAEELASVNIEIKSPSGIGFWLLNLAPFLFPILFIVFLFWLISKQVKGSGGMQAFTFGKSKARMIDPSNKNERITFKDVAGAKEAKEELVEIVDFLKNPKKFLDIGARIPKGVLLMGAPGTGKTLLARAVAGEAQVPFFIISGSEFVEMFVGVGASRVRDLFSVAKKEAPSIIFVDEIDAVGRVRGGGAGGGSDEREQTLNQILVEMDGFEPHEKVIVMAATNRPDVLDPALLRPGRFDRRVMLDLPDRDDREEILKIHSRGKTFAEDVNIRTIAERTPGFSGADLFSLMNESAILAAREERKQIAQFDLVRSVEKVMLGPERKSHVLSKKEKKITAYHEAGHALVASILAYSDPVHKVSVIARGQAGGYMLKLPIEERRMQSKKEFLDDIAVSLGGYATERMVFDDLTTGPSSDLQVSTALARDMVTKYGMSDKIGAMALESSSGSILVGRGVSENAHSEEMSKMIDAEVSRIIDEALVRAENVLTEHRKALDSIASKLIEVETLEKADFEKLLILNGIEPKKGHGLEISVLD